MTAESRGLELEGLGSRLSTLRRSRGWSQPRLATACGITQSTVSLIESGKSLPSLEVLLAMARAFDVPLQRFLTGEDRPTPRIEQVAFQLRACGIADLWVEGALVPGAFLTVEELIAWAISGGEPSPRVVEGLPVVLAWNRWDPLRLRFEAKQRGALHRVAWLASIVLTIEKGRGFPGGCPVETIERFLKGIPLPTGSDWDSIGNPKPEEPRAPVWRRWRIRYDATIGQFEARAQSLRERRMVEILRKARVVLDELKQRSSARRTVNAPTPVPSNKAPKRIRPVASPDIDPQVQVLARKLAVERLKKVRERRANQRRPDSSVPDSE